MTHDAFNLAVLVYCCLTRASESGGFRTEQRNALKGGVKHSPHRYGLGRDVVYDVPLPEPERRETATRLGLYLHVEDDHDHLQPLDWKKG